MRFFLFSFLCSMLLVKPALAAPQVVVSIAPLHSLVSALTQELYEPQLLLKQASSPHQASLKPSQARALSQADLFIWIGPELESFLQSPVARLVKPEREMRLLTLSSLELLPQRAGGVWEEEEHHEEELHSDSHQINPHIWLSPKNAQQISFEIVQHLIRIDPSNRDGYELNYRKLKRRIEQLKQELSVRLESIADKPYLVYHDAFHYLEAAFSLNAVGSIRVSADRQPGARRLAQISRKISESSAVCLFSEPQFSSVLAQRLASGNKLKLGILDPLGIDIPPGTEGWFALMENLAKNLEDCLGEEMP